ncbi:MAG: hypothetical protein R3E01_34490 [Pirellulaceae bacterium]
MNNMEQRNDPLAINVVMAFVLLILLGHTGLAATRANGGTGNSVLDTGRAGEADELVSEALQREVYGLQVERCELLQGALEKDASHDAARWHSGQVQRSDDRPSMERDCQRVEQPSHGSVVCC